MEDKEPKAAKKPSSSKAKPVAKPAAKGNAAEGLNLPKEIDLIWVVALVVVAFVVGFLIRGLFPANANTVSTSDLSTYPSGSGNTSAPPLSSDQLNKGQLPQGHPNIGGESSQTGAVQTPPVPSMGNVKSDVPPSGALAPGGQSVTPTENKK